MNEDQQEKRIEVSEGLQASMDKLLHYGHGNFGSKNLRELTKIYKESFGRTLNTSCNECVKKCVYAIHNHNEAIIDEPEDDSIQSGSGNDKGPEGSEEGSENNPETENDNTNQSGEVKTEFKGTEVYSKRQLKSKPIEELKEIASSKNIEGYNENLSKRELVELIAGHEK